MSMLFVYVLILEEVVLPRPHCGLYFCTKSEDVLVPSASEPVFKAFLQVRLF